MPQSAISNLPRGWQELRAGRLNVAKLLVDESIDQEQHRLPRSFRLLVYPFAIDVPTPRWPSAAGLTAPVTILGAATAGGPGTTGGRLPSTPPPAPRIGRSPHQAARRLSRKAAPAAIRKPIGYMHRQ